LHSLRPRDVTRYLLNRRDNWGNTALHFAAWSGNVHIGDLLLSEEDTELNSKSYEFQQTPLMTAVSRGMVDFVELLLAKVGNGEGEVDVNAVDKWGRSAFDYARATKFTELEELLASAGGVSKGKILVEWGGGPDGCDIAWLDPTTVDREHTQLYGSNLGHDDIESLSADFFAREFRSLRRPGLIKGEVFKWIKDMDFWTAEHMKETSPDLELSIMCVREQCEHTPARGMRSTTLPSLLGERNDATASLPSLFFHISPFLDLLRYPHTLANTTMEETQKTESTIVEYLDMIEKFPPGQGGYEPYVFDRYFLQKNQQKFLTKVEIPGFINNGSPPSESQFALGADGSGAHPHYHESAWNAVTQGTKSWLMFRQEDAFVAAMSGAQFQKSGGWAPELGGKRCVQDTGDFAFVPHGWGHTLVNEGPMTIGLAIQFEDKSIDFGTPN
jgi:hypothetical protein